MNQNFQIIFYLKKLIINFILSDIDKFEGRNLQKRTPLMIAVEKQNIEDVTRILYDGADPNLLNPSGGSALDISSRSSSENPAITKLLIAYGADVNTT